MKLLAEARYGGGDRQALGLIAVEQRIVPSAYDMRKLPAQVVRILHTCIQSLSSCRRIRPATISRCIDAQANGSEARSRVTTVLLSNQDSSCGGLFFPSLFVHAEHQEPHNQRNCHNQAKRREV